jgi:hypothetical protein
MAPNTAPSDVDCHAAARLGLLGLMPGQELDSIMEKLAALHLRYNTFPAEVLLELACGGHRGVRGLAHRADALRRHARSTAPRVRFGASCPNTRAAMR